MCGIAGLTCAAGEDRAGPILQAMTDAIAHRGPDGEGHHIAKSRQGHAVALGHRRLSIIDLATGDQPIHLDEGRYSTVYNGEIYNYVELRAELEAEGHSFRTTSDTEVMLRAYAAWGTACFARFRGMFALAIWDDLEKRLVLARDPFGKKPLLTFRDGPDLVYASEFAALVRHPAFCAEIDEAALADYLIWKYVPGNGTLVKGVSEVPPGHFAIWADGDYREERYYTVPQHAPVAERRELNADTVAAFRAELEEAVRMRLRSDVPLGAFLSGGIDSSAIVALMAQMTDQPVKTFSIGFHETEFSELWAAKMIADRFGTEHHELKIAPEDFLGRIEDVGWQRGAPLSEMADVPLYFLSKLAGEHVKVVLSGEGSDELLGGYPKHRGEMLVSRAQGKMPRMFDGLAGFAARQLPYKYRRMAILGRVMQERDFTARQGAWFGLMGEGAARALCPGLYDDYRAFKWTDDPGADAGPLLRSLRFDKTVWLPGTLLERGDRMTMAASIEGRMPFMDTKLCDFVASLPENALVNGKSGKHILRLAMKDDLPMDILQKPKAGFRVPVHEWLRGRLKDYAHDMLMGESAALATWTDRKELTRLWDEHQSKTMNREKELWSMLTLEIFLRQLKDNMTGSQSASASSPAPVLQAMGA